MNFPPSPPYPSKRRLDFRDRMFFPRSHHLERPYYHNKNVFYSLTPPPPFYPSTSVFERSSPSSNEIYDSFVRR